MTNRRSFLGTLAALVGVAPLVAADAAPRLPTETAPAEPIPPGTVAPLRRRKQDVKAVRLNGHTLRHVRHVEWHAGGRGRAEVYTDAGQTVTRLHEIAGPGGVECFEVASSGLAVATVVGAIDVEFWPEGER